MRPCEWYFSHDLRLKIKVDPRRILGGAISGGVVDANHSPRIFFHALKRKPDSKRGILFFAFKLSSVEGDEGLNQPKIQGERMFFDVENKSRCLSN